MGDAVAYVRLDGLNVPVSQHNVQRSRTLTLACEEVGEAASIPLHNVNENAFKIWAGELQSDGGCEGCLGAVEVRSGSPSHQLASWQPAPHMAGQGLLSAYTSIA